MRVRPLRFYFSFRSPYSWIAARWLEAVSIPEDRELEYIPFWEPDATTLELLHRLGGRFLYTPMSRSKHLYILRDIQRIARKEGVHLAWPVDRDPWWERPHLAYLAAARVGRGREAFWSIYRARWEEGRDICDESTIREIAEEMGLPPELLLGAPENALVRELGAEALYRCYRDDIFGIPYFVNGRERFWGTDRFGDFLASLGMPVDRASRSGPEEGGIPEPLPAHLVVGTGAALEMDVAGGCG